MVVGSVGNTASRIMGIIKVMDEHRGKNFDDGSTSQDADAQDTEGMEDDGARHVI